MARSFLSPPSTYVKKQRWMWNFFALILWLGMAFDTFVLTPEPLHTRVIVGVSLPIGLLVFDVAARLFWWLWLASSSATGYFDVVDETPVWSELRRLGPSEQEAAHARASQARRQRRVGPPPGILLLALAARRIEAWERRGLFADRRIWVDCVHDAATTTNPGPANSLVGPPTPGWNHRPGWR